ncbi:methyl-accepting chemotaxis protein [Shewanella gelidii]|uniref:Methyl-accepting chemotaxis protein n=1 Tax=Shewanella gelidii TaxID=1642821 RepID=A0A917JKT7_9GAMM|nr:methyl-accepting chemotaxis protein [Shewanella gelidii]MCL1097043.1 methyl-accepting chemotaxis protein [Shewanella gelidii]GGI72096.1 methyl-accepting chemotaxis protein [Shewanella gelidii]
MSALLKNLSIRYQVLLPVFALVVVLAIAVGFANVKLENQLEGMNQTTSKVLENKDYVTDIVHNTFMLRISGIYSIFDKDQLARLDSELIQRMSVNKDLLAKIRKFEGLEDRVDATSIAMDNYGAFVSSTLIPLLKQRQAGDDVEAEYKRQTVEFRRLGKIMVTAIADMSKQVNTQTEVLQQASNTEHANLVKLLFIIFVVVFAVVISAAWVLSGAIVRPIKQLQQIMAEVAKGNLTVKADDQGSNEIAVLNGDVNTTVTQLNKTVSSLYSISNDVASSATELAAVMTQSEANAKMEQGEIDQVTVALNELSSTASNVSSHAVGADNSAKHADEMARQGLDIFQKSQAASEQMNATLANAADVVTQVKEQSEQISKVIEVIQSISEQTNLLALNAAIEAARAGESGRGFAVVADEVRMLAARTQDSTQEIQAIIEGLQAQSGQANESMLSSLDILHHNQELTSQANDSLESITQAITEIGDLNTQVATSAEQQSQVTQDINVNVETITEIVNQNVSGISQSASESQSLSKLAEKQSQELSFFKL